MKNLTSLHAHKIQRGFFLSTIYAISEMPGLVTLSLLTLPPLLAASLPLAEDDECDGGSSGISNNSACSLQALQRRAVQGSVCTVRCRGASNSLDIWLSIVELCIDTAVTCCVHIPTGDSSESNSSFRYCHESCWLEYGFVKGMDAMWRNKVSRFQ